MEVPRVNGLVSGMGAIRSSPVPESLGMFIKSRFLAGANDLKPKRWDPGIRLSNRRLQISCMHSIL